MVMHMVEDDILKNLFNIKKEGEDGIDGFGFEDKRAEKKAAIDARKEYDSVQNQKALMFLGALLGDDNAKTSYILSKDWCAFVQRYRKPGEFFEHKGKFYKLEGLLPQVLKNLFK
jgi:hypothetical protein